MQDRLYIKSWLPAVLLIIVVAAAYGRSLLNSFVWDDHIIIAGNSLMEGWGTLWPLLLTEDTVPGVRSGCYRPLTYLSFFIDRRIWGGEPLGYHLENLLLHAVTAILLLALLRRLTGDRTAALAGALLFALHPVNAEAVNFLAGGRNTLLAACFLLLALNLHLANVRWGSLVTFALALLSKEFGLIFLPVAFLADRLVLGRRRGFQWYVPHVAIVFAYLLIRGYVVSGGSLELEYLQRRLMMVPDLFLRYLKMLVLPYPLKAVHTVIPPKGFDSRVLVSMVGALAVLGSISLLRRRPIYLLAAAWIVLFFLPVSNILPMGHIFIAERNAYLMTIGLAIAVAAAMASAGSSRQQLIGVVMVISVAGLIGSALRSGIWRDDLTLYTAMVVESPESSIGHYNLGKYQAERGDANMALAHFQRAAEGFPRSREIYSDLGTTYWETGSNEMALRYLERSFDPESRDVNAYLLAARIAEGMGDKEKGKRYLAIAQAFLLEKGGSASFADVATALTSEAERLQGEGRRVQSRGVYRRALLFDPQSYRVLVGLGSLEAEVGSLERAVELLQRAAAVDPSNPLPHYNLSLVYRLLGRYADAEASQREYGRLSSAAPRR